MTVPATLRQSAPTSGIRAGGAAFLAGSALVHVGNYAFNVVMGRALGPALFSDLAVIVTLLMVATLGAGTLQTAAAKAGTAPGGEATHSWMKRRAVLGGFVAAAVMAAMAGSLADFFNSASPWPFAIFGLGLPALFAQAVDRGYLQGTVRFGRLALSYQTEMWIRLVGSALLVWAGFGLNGAVAALSASFVASWLVARPRRQVLPASDRHKVGAVAGAAALLALGEVLINHSDLLIIKHFNEPVVAGAYGAIAVVGRVPFFAAWSVALLAFPLVAAGRRSAARHAVAAAAGFGAIFTVIAWAVPDLIVGLLFGNGFGNLAAELGPYALASSIFAVARTVGFLELAAGRHGGAVLIFGAGVAQATAMWAVGGDIGAAVAMRLAVMAVLVAAIALWWRRPVPATAPQPA